MSDDIGIEEEWVLPPERRAGTLFVYDFTGCHDRLPEILELIAAWLRSCAEYQLEQIAMNTGDLGWSTLSVTVRELLPGDLIEQLTRQGDTDLAAQIAPLVTEYGTREGLRRAGVAYR